MCLLGEESSKEGFALELCVFFGLRGPHSYVELEFVLQKQIVVNIVQVRSLIDLLLVVCKGRVHHRLFTFGIDPLLVESFEVAIHEAKHTIEIEDQ